MPTRDRWDQLMRGERELVSSPARARQALDEAARASIQAPRQETQQARGDVARLATARQTAAATLRTEARQQAQRELIARAPIDVQPLRGGRSSELAQAPARLATSLRAALTLPAGAAALPGPPSPREPGARPRHDASAAERDQRIPDYRALRDGAAGAIPLIWKRLRQELERSVGARGLTPLEPTLAELAPLLAERMTQAPASAPDAALAAAIDELEQLLEALLAREE